MKTVQKLYLHQGEALIVECNLNHTLCLYVESWVPVVIFAFSFYLLICDPNLFYATLLFWPNYILLSVRSFMCHDSNQVLSLMFKSVMY